VAGILRGRAFWGQRGSELRQRAEHELGVTVADQQGLSFGASYDDDQIEDPELDVDEIEALARRPFGGCRRPRPTYTMGGRSRSKLRS